MIGRMIRIHNRPLVSSARLLIGLIFLAAALAKGIDLIRFTRQFETILWTLGLPVTAGVNILSQTGALGIILMEFAIAASLLSGWHTKAGAGAAAVMLLLFTAFTLWAWSVDLGESCTCFGAFLSRDAKEGAIEDVILLLAAIYLLLSPIKIKGQPKAAILILVAGLIWMTAWQYFVFPGSALRKGAKVRPELMIKDIEADRYCIWFFNPDCERCQRQIKLATILAGGASRLLGVTSASEGRTAEFELDFIISFKIIRVTKEVYRSYGVLDGTLTEIMGGKINRVWEGYLLQDDSGALRRAD